MPNSYDSRTGQTTEMGRCAWLRRKLDLKSRWHHLRAIGASRISTLAIITPVVGYLLIFNTRVEIFEESWRLSSFYLGSVLFSAGTLVFAFYCPGECKKYDTAVEYANVEATFFEANQAILVKMTLRNLERQRRPHVDVKERNRIDQIVGSLQSEDIDRSHRAGYILQLMDAHWHTLDPQSPRARMVCAAYYAFGAILIAAPGLWTALSVLWTIIR